MYGNAKRKVVKTAKEYTFANGYDAHAGLQNHKHPVVMT